MKSCSILLVVVLMAGAAQAVTVGNLVDRYSFTNGDTQAVDSVRGKNGTLTGTAAILGNQLALGGGGAVNLPADVLDPALTSVTIEAWFTMGAVNTWSRLWDFGATQGNDGGNMMMYTPASGNGDSRFVISTTGFPSWQMGENNAIAPTVAVGTPTYVACVYDGAAGEIRLYQDGALKGSAPTAMLLSGVARMNAFIGDSSYPNDPYFTGSVDEFRIWNVAMTDADVLASGAAGPAVVVPEPATLLLLGLGGLVLRRRQR